MKLNFHSAESRRIYNHLKLCGVSPASASQIMLLLHKWEKSNGEEWVVKRLKNLKTLFIQQLGGNIDVKPDWIRTRLLSGRHIPSGPFSVLFSNDVFSHPQKVKKALSALMSYTGYKLKQVTPAQIRKSLGSIASDTLDPERAQWAYKIGGVLSQQVPEIIKPEVNRYLRLKDKGFGFNPVSLNSGKPFVQSGNYLRSFLQGLNIPVVYDYLSKHFGVPAGMVSLDIESYSVDTEEYQPLPGEIALIQERGAKARVVAMPNSAAQMALAPLNTMLMGILRDLPSDCTHDQDSGAEWAFEKLSQGRQMFSVDISSATDNFPLLLQLGILDELGLREESLLIKELSRSPWRLSKALRAKANQMGYQDYISYGGGQPMGLNSSFTLFALAHNLLVRKLASKVKVDPNDSFRIVGDDIVISDSNLHAEYRRTLSELGVPISEDKSISSTELAEFAGFVITHKGYWKPAKVPDPGDFRFENSFMNYLKVVGHEGIRNLPSKIRKVAMKVAELPEDLGGLGFNPHGLSYEERVRDFLVTQKDPVIPRYLGMDTLFERIKFADRSFSEGEMSILRWLYDQYNHFKDSSIAWMVNTMPERAKSLANSNISDPVMLAYQFSAFLSIADVPDARVYRTSVQGEDPSRFQFRSEFQQWKEAFSSVTDGSDSDVGPGHEETQRDTKKYGKASKSR